MRRIRRLLVGVRSHGGEEVYSTLLRDKPPENVAGGATFDFHASCPGARCGARGEVLLNRLLHPWLRFDLGFRVLDVGAEVELIHIHSHPTILRRLGGRPVVFSAGSSHFHYARDYMRWDEAKIRLRYARALRFYRPLGVIDALLNDRHVTLSYTFSEYGRSAYLLFGVAPDKIRVLAPGFEIPEPRRKRTGDEVVFLFLGRQPARKGGPDVLEAFARLRESVPAARLLYVTDEPPPRAAEGVEVRPLVAPAEVRGLYAEADVFLNPTRAEGFGFTNVEAQGCGVPVISSRLGAIPEVVEDGRTGVLVEPGQHDELLDAMRRLAQSRGLRDEMGMAGRARFESRFSLAVFQRALRALYDEALDRAGGA